MPVTLKIQDVIAKNVVGIEAAEKCNHRIDQLLMQPMTPDDKLALLDEQSRASNERTQLKIINANLTAAIVTVKPIDNALAAELNTLANRLETKIQTNQIISAALDFVTATLDEVSNLHDITGGATG